jgi:hypothetical protein
MKEQQADYLRFAAAARLEASSVVLDNVRQKLLLSAATWEGLAHAAHKVTEARARSVAERLATSLDLAVGADTGKSDVFG